MKSFLILLTFFFCQLAVFQATYTLIDPSNYTKVEGLQDSLNYGGRTFILKEVRKANIPSGTYQITDVNSIEQDVLKNGVDYRFNLSIYSVDMGTKVKGHVVVYYKWSDKSMKVVSYHYDYTYPTAEFEWQDYDFEEVEQWDCSEEINGETYYPGEGEDQEVVIEVSEEGVSAEELNIELIN